MTFQCPTCLDVLVGVGTIVNVHNIHLFYFENVLDTASVFVL